MSKRITLKDLAALAGVSPSTVSKALSGSKEIPQVTRRRIQEIAEMNHYEANRFARGLRSEKSHTIGMLIPDNSNLYYARLLKGAEDILRSSGYSLVLSNTNEDASLERERLAMMRSLRVDGLLATPVAEEHFDDLDIPFVFLSRCRLDKKSRRYNYAINNDFRGAYLAASYLLQQGKRNLFFISGPRNISIAAQRKSGFLTALNEAGIPFRGDHILYGNLTPRDGWNAMDAILRLASPPFGVFCSSDNLAIGVLAAAREKGLHIPGEVGIVGCDNIETLEYLDHPLTTIGQARYQIGAQGARILLDLIAAGQSFEAVSQIKFEPELIIRNT